MTEPGELVGKGRTSEVYAYGNDAVVKVAHADVPDDWLRLEAELTSAVWNIGVPAPKVLDLVEVGGRKSVVFERIDGPSMWQAMIDAPDDAQDLARMLAGIHKQLLGIGIPPGIPDLVDRLVRKIRLATPLDDQARQQAEALALSLPRGAALLHGDLHPGNVLMGSSGPVVIDWFDATIGHPIADIVRSSILTQPGADGAPHHLPGATDLLLALVRDAYLIEFRSELEIAGSLPAWQAVVAAARLAEGAELDERVLLDLWMSRTDDDAGLALLVS